MPLVATRFFTEDTICRVEVNTPSTKCHRIIKLLLFNNILLLQYIITFKSPAFPFAGNRTHPFKRKVRCFGKQAGIFYIVPDSVNNPPELPFYFFGLVYG